jgi:hypothetical protein
MGREVLHVKKIPSIWAVIEIAFSSIDNVAVMCVEMHKQQYETSAGHSFSQVFINLIKYAVLGHFSYIRS